MLASAGFFFVFMTFVKKGGLSDEEAITVFAYFRDASGLGKKSRVQIAGIPVGEVGEITLVRVKETVGGEEKLITRAKVILKIRRDVNLRQDAALTKRSESLLGDYLLDLYPGSDTSQEMAEGGQIVKVNDKQGVEAIFESLDVITKDIGQVTSALSQVLGGKKGAGSLERIVENMVKLSDTVDVTVRASAERLDAILRNFESFSQDVKKLSEGQDESVRTIVSNVEKITEDVRDVLGTVKKVLGSGEGELKDSVASLKQTLNRLDSSLQNLEAITGKVRDGEGAVGALLTDERLGQKVSESVEDLADFASRLTQIETEVSMRSEYLMGQGQAKNALGIRLIPKPDKYYLLEFVDDPRGTIETQVVQSNPPSSGEPVSQTQRITREGLKISAQFAKRYYFTTLRFGIIESTGGIGSDFHFFDDALTFRFDAFNFSVEELKYPRLRAAVRLQAFDHLFATAGVDDVLNVQLRDATNNRLIAGRDFFVGAGIYFTDEDLKAILSIAPTPSP